MEARNFTGPHLKIVYLAGRYSGSTTMEVARNIDEARKVVLTLAERRIPFCARYCKPRTLNHCLLASIRVRSIGSPRVSKSSSPVCDFPNTECLHRRQ
jgi:hypothetical protein